MDTTPSDVKTEATSSVAEDVKTETASSAVDNAAKTDVKPAPTLAEVAQKVFDESTKNEESSTETAEEESEDKSVSKIDTDKEAESEEKVDEAKSEDAEETTQTEESEDKGPVPYDRFKTKVEEVAQYKQKVEQLEPKAQIYDQWVNRLSTNNVAESDFAAAVDVLCLAQTDPTAALAQLQPIVDRLKAVTGDAIPADLQAELNGIDQEVSDGTITQARANQLKKMVQETAKLRGKTTLSQHQIQLSQKQAQLQRQQAYQREVGQALQAWTTSKQSTDPDFAMNGRKYNIFVKTFSTNLATASSGSTLAPAAVIKVAENTLAEVNNWLKGLTTNKAPAPGKSLSSTKSSTKQNGAPKSALEAAQLAAAKHGIKFAPQ